MFANEILVEKNPRNYFCSATLIMWGGAHLLFQYLFSNDSDLTQKLLHRVGHLNRYYYPVQTGPNYF
ncbi:hypothetical protein BpHYR1_043882 [Brachionus plicatilis]|uniref:Uncharacterized protein n=1 Tax=Brachionus plicatilis TaxID=10195 RepID=A0A3M7T7X7_BRAPC|nr:hypothetical protein BpHYR1_043882 [Brachionus plicatilis]